MSKKIHLGREPAALKKWRKWMLRSLQDVLRALDVEVTFQAASRTVDDHTGRRHVVLSGSGGGGNSAIDHNWKVTVVDTTHVTVSPGTVDGGYPTIGGVSIATSPAPELGVDDEDVNYIYLQVTITLNVVSGTVISHTVTGRSIIASNSILSSTTTTRYFLLATHDPSQPVASRVTPARFWSISMLTQDDGTSTSTPEFSTGVEG